MTVSDNNKRVPVTMPKELYKDIEDLADKEDRSVSNYIVSKLKKIVAEEKEV